MTRLVEVWLNRLVDGSSRRMAEGVFNGFIRWCRERGEFKSSDEMVEFQKQAVGDDRYKIVDLAVEHIQEKGGTYKSMQTQYTAIRSFFMHSRAELPRVPIQFKPTKDSNIGRLDQDIFLTVLKASDLMEQAVYLSLFQGMMDQERFQDLNHDGFQLGLHIKQNGVNEPYRINFLRGRKTNRQSYNSFLGRDALSAWQLYFDRVRGYPKEGEAAALDLNKHPITKRAFYVQHNRLLRKVGYINGYGNKGTRYGYGLHELRDLARSILEKAKGDGFNTNSAEFWMGHTVDPLFYNKIWKLDPEYNLEQYRIAEKYLNIMSGGMQTDNVDTLLKSPQDLRKLARALEDYGFMISKKQ